MAGVLQDVAFAKINLALHVREREADGYHRIETLFAFAEDGDRVEVAPAEALTLATRGPFSAELGEDNLVLRAAALRRDHYGISAGAALTLEKNLPVASGLGGGSADAAAALRLLTRCWGLEIDEARLIDLARLLGADVAACLRSETARGEGRGDRLVSQDGSGLAGMPLLLVNPGFPVSTSAVFENWDGIDRGPLAIASPLASALEGRNDLEAPACALVPEIRDVLQALAHAPGASLARMSGSGATCFALFEGKEDRDQAFETIAASQPGWWQLRTRIR